jgi:hypothetical protein
LPDVPRAFLQHRRLQRPGEQDRRLEVDAQGSSQLLGAVVGESPGAGQAGVGDEDVDVARFGRELLGGASLS